MRRRRGKNAERRGGGEEMKRGGKKMRRRGGRRSESKGQVSWLTSPKAFLRLAFSSVNECFATTEEENMCIYIIEDRSEENTRTNISKGIKACKCENCKTALQPRLFAAWKAGCVAHTVQYNRVMNAYKLNIFGNLISWRRGRDRCKNVLARHGEREKDGNNNDGALNKLAETHRNAIRELTNTS